MKLEMHSSRGLRGETCVPGDKSISHRALIFASIARGRSRIRGLSPGRDVRSTRRCLQRMGVRMKRSGESLVIDGNGRRGLGEAGTVLDCGNSGTTARLLMGLCAGYPFASVFTGDRSLRRRPMIRVTEPLVRMGARIDGRMEGDRLPLCIRGGTLSGISFEPPVASAQVKSALLLAGLSAEGRTRITEREKTRDHSERLLEAMGASLVRSDGSTTVEGGSTLSPIDFTVPGDLSSAAFLIAAAVLIPGSSLVIRDVGLNQTRTGFLRLLEKMGARVTCSPYAEAGPEPRGDISVEHSSLAGIIVSGEEAVSAIDELPLLAVLAVRARGETRIEGASELRVKESDRIRAITEGLRKMGADIEEREDGLTVRGPKDLCGADVRSRSDHRIALSLAVAGMVARGKTNITSGECIDVSFPGFVSYVERLQS